MVFTIARDMVSTVHSADHDGHMKNQIDKGEIIDIIMIFMKHLLYQYTGFFYIICRKAFLQEGQIQKIPTRFLRHDMRDEPSFVFLRTSDIYFIIYTGECDLKMGKAGIHFIYIIFKGGIADE